LEPGRHGVLCNWADDGGDWHYAVTPRAL
jgi:hypothetical protein